MGTLWWHKCVPYVGYYTVNFILFCYCIYTYYPNHCYNYIFFYYYIYTYPSYWYSGWNQCMEPKWRYSMFTSRPMLTKFSSTYPFYFDNCIINVECNCQWIHLQKCLFTSSPLPRIHIYPLPKRRCLSLPKQFVCQESKACCCRSQNR